jgi:hypothetical protein
MLLNIYFDIFGPAIKILAKAYPSLPDGDLSGRLGEITTLPLSWRQVRRITTSFYIIVYAFWQGEASEDEAGRACAYAALLLDFQRTKWGPSLDNARKTIQSLAKFESLTYHYFGTKQPSSPSLYSLEYAQDGDLVHGPCKAEAVSCEALGCLSS